MRSNARWRSGPWRALIHWRVRRPPGKLVAVGGARRGCPDAAPLSAECVFLFRNIRLHFLCAPGCIYTRLFTTIGIYLRVSAQSAAGAARRAAATSTAPPTRLRELALGRGRWRLVGLPRAASPCRVKKALLPSVSSSRCPSLPRPPTHSQRPCGLRRRLWMGAEDECLGF